MPDEVVPLEDTFTPIATQAEYDRRLGGRLAEERRKFSDYNDLKEKAAKFDQVDAAAKSELQKLQDAISERDAQLADLPKQIRQQAITFASQASHAGFLDPEDALAFIDGVDLGDRDAVKAALADLAERKPHLVRAPDKKKLPGRPRPEKGDDADLTVGDGLKGKERAAAAMRQFRNT